MLTPANLRGYQNRANGHIIDHYGSMLWLDIGFGKTVVSLTAIEHLLDSYSIKATLVIAPLKVIEAVWAQEGQTWSHTKRLKFSMVRGTPKQRMEALLTPADVYLINYEQLTWLAKTITKFWLKKDLSPPFDAVVFDEVSKMKTATTKRGRAFAKILPIFRYRWGLTGTPAANGLMDLHGQYLMIDGGARLGPNITSFRNRWFTQCAYSQKWVPNRGAREEILQLISDITLEMRGEEYLQLPPVVDQDHIVALPETSTKQYKEFEQEFFTTLGDGSAVEAFNAGAKSVKCRQLANGAVYTSEDRSQWGLFHDEKLDALEEIVEGLNGSPLLCCYQFRHDVERIKKRFPHVETLDRKNVAEKIARWNAGEIKLLIGHPMSMGHGLNLQHGGNHVAWFGIPWSRDLYDQAIGRLCRGGQKGASVVNHRIMAGDTVETGVMLKVLEGKGAEQEDVREAVKRYRAEKEMLR